MSLSKLPSLPLTHRSTARIGPPVPMPAGYAIESECPLFAADQAFARANGGSLTQSVLDCINLTPEQRVVVDSSLVWLSPGLAHELAAPGPLAGPRTKVGFLHEPFPGIMSGVCGDANHNRNAFHYLAVFGLDCTPELVEGEISFESPVDARSFWLPSECLEFRELEIARLLNMGQLQTRTIPLATVVAFGWGTLMRSRPATAHGFQFLVRVTVGDDRPHVNGRRNLAQL